MADFNKIISNSPINIIDAQMAILGFIDGKASLSSNYSLNNNNLTLLQLNESEISVFYNHTVATVYEYEIPLTQAGIQLPELDSKYQKIQNLNKNTVLVFVDGILQQPSEYTIGNDMQTLTFNFAYPIKSGNTNKIIVYSSPNKTIFRQIIPHKGDLISKITSNASNTASDTINISYNVNNTIFLKNGEKIPFYDINDKDTLNIQLNVDITDDDVLEVVQLDYNAKGIITTRSVNFKTDMGYLSYGPYDTFGNKVPQLYDTIVEFADQAKLAVDNLRPGFLIKEENGFGELIIVSDTFEDTTVLCLKVQSFRNTQYSSSEYYLEVPTYKQITHYLAEYDKQFKFLPEILEIFQRLLLDEINDSIQRLREIRSITKVDSDNINKLISLLGCNLNIKTLTLKQRHELLEELNEFHGRAGTRNGYNFLNILQNDLKLINIEQLFTPHSPRTLTNNRVYDNTITVDATSPGSGYAEGMTVNIGNTGLTTIISEVDKNGGVVAVSEETLNDSNRDLTGRYELNAVSPYLQLPVTSTPTDYQAIYSISDSKAYHKGDKLTTADGEYSIEVTEVDNNGTITDWTPRTSDNKKSITEVNLPLYEKEAYSTQATIDSTSYNEKTNRNRVLPINLSKPTISGKTLVAEVSGSNYKVFEVQASGWYSIEVAGSAGTSWATSGGQGGYVSSIIYLYKGTQCLLWGANSTTTGYPAKTNSFGGTGGTNYNQSGGCGGGAANDGINVYGFGKGGAGAGFIAGFTTKSDIPLLTHKESAWAETLSTHKSLSVKSGNNTVYDVSAIYVYVLAGGGGGSSGGDGNDRSGGGGGGAWGNGGGSASGFNHRYLPASGPGGTWGKGANGGWYGGGANGGTAILDFSTNTFTAGLGGNGSTTGYTKLYKIETIPEEILIYSKTTPGSFSVNIPHEINVTRIELAGADGGKAWTKQGDTYIKNANTAAYPSGEKLSITQSYILANDTTITGTIGATPSKTSVTSAINGGAGDEPGQDGTNKDGIQSGAGGGATTIIYNSLKYGVAGGKGQDFASVVGATGGQPLDLSPYDNLQGKVSNQGAEADGYIKIYGQYKQAGGKVPVYNSTTPGVYDIVLQPGFYSYNMSGGGGSGGTTDGNKNAWGDGWATNGFAGELKTGTFTLYNTTKVKIYVAGGGKRSYADAHAAPWAGDPGTGYKSGERGAAVKTSSDKHHHRRSAGGSGGGSSAIVFLDNTIIAKGGNGGDARQPTNGNFLGGYGGVGGSGGNTSGTGGASGGARNTPGTTTKNMYSYDGQDGWVTITMQSYDYNLTLSDTSDLYTGDLLRTIDDEKNIFSVYITNTNPLEYTVTPNYGFADINKEVNISRVQNTSAKLSISSNVTQYRYNYGLPQGEINDHIIPGLTLYATDEVSGVDFGYKIESISRRKKQITGGILSPEYGPDYVNTTLYPQLQGYNGAYVFISSSENAQSSMEREYISFKTKEELGAVLKRRYDAERTNYGFVNEGTPNAPNWQEVGLPDINYDAVNDETTEFHDYGLVTDRVAGKWVEWWEWDRDSEWYPTNHVRIEMKIPTGVNYNEYVTRFTEQFYNLASTVLYIHELITSFYFGRDVTDANDPDNTQYATFGIKTGQPVVFETVTFTSDPRRQYMNLNNPE